MTTHSIIELLGDGISAELSKSIHTVADTLPFELDFQAVDLSDEARRRGAPTHSERGWEV